MLNLMTYATWRYEKSRQRLLASAKRFGKFQFWNFSDKDFQKTEIYSRLPEIAKTSRGAGLWLWKPYFIQHVLREINEEDYLIYLDSGIELIAKIDPLIKLADINKGVALFTVHEKLNRHWTKRDCFVYMNVQDSEYLETEQSMSGIIVLKKNKFVLNLVAEWLEYNSDIRIVSDQHNICGLPNYEGFVEHRHDQSILNNLRIKYHIASYVDPTQFGDPYRYKAQAGVDDYQSLLNLHRERAPSWQTALKLLCTDQSLFLKGVYIHIKRLMMRFFR